jgi:hypothetical protein
MECVFKAGEKGVNAKAGSLLPNIYKYEIIVLSKVLYLSQFWSDLETVGCVGISAKFPFRWYIETCIEQKSKYCLMQMAYTQKASQLGQFCSD